MKTNNDIVSANIQKMIFTIRGVQIMFDRDLAVVYGVETKVLNQAVKRNIDRFPQAFRFQLTESELEELVMNGDRFNLRSQIVTSSGHGGRRYLPFVFTEQGVSMLSAVLKSAKAEIFTTLAHRLKIWVKSGLPFQNLKPEPLKCSIN